MSNTMNLSDTASELATAEWEVSYFRMKSEGADIMGNECDADHYTDKMLDAMMRRDALRTRVAA